MMLHLGCEGRLYKMFSCVVLRNMDFLKYSGEVVAADATALYARPCAFRAFWDFRVPKLLGIQRNIKKISYSCAMTASRTFCAICQ